MQMASPEFGAVATAALRVGIAALVLLPLAAPQFTAKEIAEKLKKQYGVDVDKRKIELDGDIKAFGTYRCEVKLYTGISAKVYVVVTEA